MKTITKSEYLMFSQAATDGMEMSGFDEEEYKIVPDEQEVDDIQDQD